MAASADLKARVLKHAQAHPEQELHSIATAEALGEDRRKVSEAIGALVRNGRLSKELRGSPYYRLAEETTNPPPNTSDSAQLDRIEAMIRDLHDALAD